MEEMSAKLYKRDLPLIIGTVAALIVILEFFWVPTPEIQAMKAEILVWTTISAAFCMLVGAVATFILQYSRLTSGDSTKTKLYAGTAIAVMVIFVAVGALMPGQTTAPEYVLLYDHIFAALARSVRAAAFFAALIGAYHAFRAKTLDAAVMLVAGSIYLFRSFAAGVYFMPIMLPLGDWVAEVPNVAATRGGLIAAAIGALILAVRVFTGTEKAVEEVLEEV
jgi:hypothetical protein